MSRRSQHSNKTGQQMKSITIYTSMGKGHLRHIFYRTVSDRVMVGTLNKADITDRQLVDYRKKENGWCLFSQYTSGQDNSLIQHQTHLKIFNYNIHYGHIIWHFMKQNYPIEYNPEKFKLHKHDLFLLSVDMNRYNSKL